MKNLVKRYRLFLIIVLIDLLFLLIRPAEGLKSWQISANNLLDLVLFLPPIFVLLGLLDIWVPRETMIKLMGEKSGIIGILLAFLLGSAAAGPLYAAFPIAGVLLKKGSKFSNILIFIGACSTTKIPMLLFELSAMGWKFMLTRFIVDIPGIMLIAFILEKAISTREKEVIVENVKALS